MYFRRHVLHQSYFRSSIKMYFDASLFFRLHFERACLYFCRIINIIWRCKHLTFMSKCFVYALLMKFKHYPTHPCLLIRNVVARSTYGSFTVPCIFGDGYSSGYFLSRGITAVSLLISCLFCAAGAFSEKFYMQNHC